MTHSNRTNEAWTENLNILTEQIGRLTEVVTVGFAEMRGGISDLKDGMDDLKVVLERDLKDLERQIKEAKRAATAALTLEAKLAGQKQVKDLEKLRNQKRRSLFDAQDEVDEQRDRLIAQIEGKLEQKSEIQSLFTIRWSLG